MWCVVCRCRAERPEPEPLSRRGAVRAPRAARRAAGVGVAVCGRPEKTERCAVGLSVVRCACPRVYTFYAFLAPAGVFILFMRPEDCDHPMPVAKSDAACCARDGNATSSCIEAKPSEQSALQVYGGAAAPSGYHNQSEEWHAPASTRRRVARVGEIGNASNGHTRAALHLSMLRLQSCPLTVRRTC